ncbi:hypothetical protein GPJ56_002957 [Histomonas meleagridis]|uniref:uncharacterized protein n=1 Tax=Histomonas meleagridis TaxID=135588 RepID=UPI00355AA764|nr:hypothetical protein GPJ56_002957 [Histomonas meleagridis]KAH0796616.1 hypothetical protein GO595_010509 [Histomonas meleagridis]
MSKVTSLNQQFQIYTNETSSKQILAYDQKAIQSFVDLLCQCDKKFKKKFFNIVFANALKVTDCERSSEPFLILMALGDQFDSKNIFQLLLFSIVAFQNNRTELVDVLIDIINQRLLSDSLDEKLFQEEVISVISVFLLYLSMDCRFSLSLHLIKVIKEISRKISKINDTSTIRMELENFLMLLGGDEYAASLYEKFIGGLKSLGDPATVDIIEALFELAKLLGNDGWCLLLALLTDAYRHFIGVYSNRTVMPVLGKEDDEQWKDIDSFMSYIAEKFTDTNYKLFVVNFYANAIKNFQNNDLNRENVAIMMIRSFLKVSQLALDPLLIAKLVKLCFLISITDSENEPCAKLIHDLVSNLKVDLPAENMALYDLKPEFIEMTFKTIGYYQTEKRTVVSPKSLPFFPTFMIGKVDPKKVIETLFPFISSKLEAIS